MRDEFMLAAIFLALAFLFSSCTITLHEANFFFPETYPKIPDHESGPVSVKNVDITPEKDITLSGLVIRYSGAKDYLLYFYGNGSSVVESYRRLEYLSACYKVNVVCFDYRGYGFSSGKPGFDALLSDGLFIYDHVRSSYMKDKGKIFVYTQSIGTAPGLQVASSRPVDGIIMEAGFTNGKDAVSHMTDKQPWLSRLLVHLKADDQLAKHPDPPVEKIKRVKAPLLYVLGTEDEVFPFWMGKELFMAAGSSDKTICPIEGAGHNNLDITSGRYKEETGKFFNKYL